MYFVPSLPAVASEARVDAAADALLDFEAATLDDESIAVEAEATELDTTTEAALVADEATAATEVARTAEVGTTTAALEVED